MEQRNYSDDLNVDVNALDKEWEKQPKYYMYYATQEAEAQEVRDKAVQRLSIVKSEMDAKVRKNPEVYGIEKVTETAISNVVNNDKEYREAENAIIEATKQMKIITAAVIAFDHKKRALTKLTDLWIAGYYSSGGVPVAMKEKINEDKSEKIRAKLNKREK
jgi:hypothetical protein